MYYDIRISLISVLIACGCITACTNPRQPGNMQTVTTRAPGNPEDVEHGKQIFAGLCQQCHFAPDAHVTDNTTFHKLFDRQPRPGYFIDYIRDSKAMKDAGDAYALDIDKKWEGSNYEHHFKDRLSAKDMECLVLYIKTTGR